MNPWNFTPNPDLARAQTPPAEWYTDAHMLAMEKQKVFRSTWQYAVSLDLLRLPGNYAAVEVNGIPVVLTRATDGEIRAFYNVCRHRAGLVARLGHGPVAEAVRAVLERHRREILGGAPCPAAEAIEAEVLARLAEEARGSLRPVVNATGVVVHTNLGRAPLSAATLEAMRRVAGGYTNLEYDLEAGERGDRYGHAEAPLCRLTGAEAAVVVNNNASAVMLALGALMEATRPGAAGVPAAVTVVTGEEIDTRRYPTVDERALLYLRDVYDHVVRFYDIIDTYRDLASSALDTYLSSVSNNLNDVMKRLKAIKADAAKAAESAPAEKVNASKSLPTSN